MADKTVRLKDIADRVGTSTVTVSKALSGQSGMSDALREQILSAAEEMGYVPRAKKKQENTIDGYRIGLIAADRYMDKYVSFYAHIQQQAAAEAAKKGCVTLLEGISDEAEKGCTLPNIIQENQCDGIIVIGKTSKDYLTALKKRNVPAIYLDFSDNSDNADSIVSDNYYGAYTLTNYLFSKGHRDIAYVGTVLSTSSITDRYFGYMRSMLEHKAEVKKEWVIDDRDMKSGIMDTVKFFKLPRTMPTAFVCNSDLAASMLISKLRSLNIRVPEDVSVVGYDNFLYPGLCDIGITTFDVDTKEMSKKAVHNLIHKLKGESYQRGVVIVGGRLIEKESVLDISNKY